MKSKILLILFVSLSLSSCSSLMSNNGSKRAISSSLMDFLYPDKAHRREHKSELPVLQLPVNVGLAFVPSNHSRSGIHARDQIKLLNRVKQSFLNYKFINRIEVIPSQYLKRGKGFSTLDQVSRLYDVDIMALISYDQLTQSQENSASLLYWTIVGMYVIPGNDNSVQTFVDTAIFDVKSRKMLFRAPGISKVSKSSSAVDVDAVLAQKSQQGFSLAVADMTKNLDAGLADFRERVKNEKVANVVHRRGYQGGGSISLFLFMLFTVGLFKKRRTLKQYLR